MDGSEHNLCVCVCVDVFSQVSDSSGVLLQSKFDAFLREALKLPTTVHEGPSFGYTNNIARSCFPQQVRSHTSSICPLLYVYFIVIYLLFLDYKSDSSASFLFSCDFFCVLLSLT